MYKRNHTEYCILLSKNIKILLTSNHWNLKTLSEKSDIPYDTLTKIMNHTISNPTLSTLMKLSTTFNCTIDSLLHEDFHTQTRISSLPSHIRTTLYYMMNFIHLHQNQPTSVHSKFVPLHTPFDEVSTSVQYNFSKVEALDVCSYEKRYQNQISFAIRIRNNNYHPVFFENDILLFGSNRTPQYGEIGLFAHNNTLYLRQFFPGAPIRLVSVNQIGTPIILSTLNNWHILGYAITLHQS
ncbi:MAG: helix-turn-helix domain-containing protein [Eubacteriales bacterium]